MWIMTLAPKRSLFPKQSSKWLDKISIVCSVNKVRSCQHIFKSCLCTYHAHCGNLTVFLSSTFYVKIKELHSKMNINFLTAKSDKILFKTEKISISTLSQNTSKFFIFWTTNRGRRKWCLSKILNAKLDAINVEAMIKWNIMREYRSVKFPDCIYFEHFKRPGVQCAA